MPPSDDPTAPGVDLGHLNLALADRYEIEGEIDTGGMATVYRARDLKHDRTVAVKVLRPDLTEAIGADRFLKEIRTTANLSHPHILPLFDSGEAGGYLYYVMPFVKGESLRDRLKREGQLPVEDAIQIAREVADALAYAHRNGVIHRDIKPANVMLDEGHALLADFGIAQAKAGADETRLTGMGTSLGTPTYMSPEQISGEGEVDGRADQYALACVLYEMLAGHPPFTGTDVQLVLRQHLAADAPKVTGARASVPTGVAKAIHRGLAKIPADRYRTVSEFEKALAGATLPLLARIPTGRAREVVYAATVILAVAAVVMVALKWAEGPAEPAWAPDPNVIAVVPFENRTGDPAYDRLGIQIASDVESRLQGAEIGQPLAARSVAPVLATVGAQGDPVAALSAELGAGTVVTGFIDLRNDSLEITASCADAASGADLYALGPVRGATADQATLTAQIRDRVAGALAFHLDTDNPYRATGAPPLNPEAYEEYRRAMEIGGDNQNWGEMANRLLRAWSLDTTFIDAALVGYMETYQATLLSQGDWREQMDSLYAYLTRSEGRMTRGQRYSFDAMRLGWEGDGEAALREFRAASEIYPLEFAYDLGHAALFRNRAHEALQAFGLWKTGDGTFRENFVRHWPYYFHQYADAYHRLGRFQEELEMVMEGRRRYPDHADMLSAEVQARIGLGQTREVRAMIPEVRREGGVGEVRYAVQEMIAHGMGDLAQEVIQEELHRFGADSTYFPDEYRYPEYVFYSGRPGEAHALFEKIAEGYPDNPWRWAWVGITAPLAGDTAQALALEQRFGEWAREGWPAQNLSWVRAQIRATLGDPEGAVRYLEQAYYREGKSFTVDLHRTFSLQRLQGTPVYDEFVRPKG